MSIVVVVEHARVYSRTPFSPFFLLDTDMNSELIAHGYANALSGMFGGKC
jgi:hypothetical protein